MLLGNVELLGAEKMVQFAALLHAGQLKVWDEALEMQCGRVVGL